MLIKHCMALAALYGALLMLDGVVGLQPSAQQGLSRGRLPVANADCAPLQVHVGLGKTPQEMHISWTTEGSSCPSQALIKAGTAKATTLEGDADATLVYGYNFLLSERDMCSEPAASNVFALQLHRVHLGDLVPGGWYQYQVVGSDQVDTFRAAPVSSPTYQTTFVAYGDLGDPVHAEAKSPGAEATLRTLARELEGPDLDLVMHVGDISYANGNPVIWDSFMDAITPLTRRVPYMVAIGNHEYSWYDPKHGDSTNDPSGAQPYQPNWSNYGADSGGECGVMAARRFYMPLRRPSDVPPFWYGFDHGSVHFTVISTEHDVTKGSRQREWLEQELAAVDRCATPWLVLIMHRPMYVVYPHKSNREVGQHLRDSLEDLLLQHRVDATIAGHVHSYYRSCAVADDKCMDEADADLQQQGEQQQQRQPQQRRRPFGFGAADKQRTTASSTTTTTSKSSRSSSNTKGLQVSRSGGGSKHGVVHFVIGSAGHKLSRIDGGQEDWCAHKLRSWGYGRFQVLSDTQMLMQFVGSEEGAVLDEVVVQASAERLQACTTRMQSHMAAA